jgi:hypothetical protein
MFHDDDIFSICTRHVDADTLSRRHVFYRQFQCTIDRKVMRIKRKTKTNKSESIGIVDFSPLTSAQITAAEKSSHASPLAPPNSELVDFSVEIISQEPSQSITSSSKTRTDGQDEIASDNTDVKEGSKENEEWHEANAATLT